MQENFLQENFAARIGGNLFGKDTKIYKFEKIKRAKRAAMAENPGVELIDMGVGEPDDMAFPAVVDTLCKEAANWENRIYADNGCADFKAAAARYMKALYGVELDADFGIIRSDDILWTADVNAAYNINEGLEYDTLPKIYGGLGTSLSMYGFTLGADFSGAALFNIMNANLLMADNTLKPEDCLERGDYFRLDCLSLSYKVPCKVRWIRDFKVNLSAHNLFTITDYSGWNPDVNSFGVTARIHGVDYGSYPLRRQVVLGVSFRF